MHKSKLKQDDVFALFVGIWLLITLVVIVGLRHIVNFLTA